MACECGDITAGQATFTFQPEGTTPSGFPVPIELVTWGITKRNGIPLLDTQPAWATLVAGTGSVVGSAGAYRYQLPLTLTIDVQEAWPFALDVYTFQYTVIRTDCLGSPRTCTLTMRLQNACQAVAVEVTDWLYWMGGNSIGNQLSLWRFRLDGDRTREFHRQLVDFTLDGGIGDNDAFKIKGLRYDARLGILVGCDLGTKFFSLSERGRIETLMFAETETFQHYMFDVITATEELVYMTQASGNRFLRKRSYDGATNEVLFFVGTVAPDSPDYGPAYNTLNSYVYYGQRNGALARIKKDGTDRAVVSTTPALTGLTSALMWQFFASYGAGGGILFHGTFSGHSGWIIFDVAAGTVSAVAENFATELFLHWAPGITDRLLLNGDAITGNPPVDEFRVINYAGVIQETLPDFRAFAPYIGQSHVRTANAWTDIETIPGFFLRATPNEAFEGFFEVYEDTAATDPAEIGDGVARMTDQGILRKNWQQDTAANRPILRQTGSTFYLEFDGTNDAMKLLWDPAGLNGDEVSVFMVMRPKRNSQNEIYFRHRPGDAGNVYFQFHTRTDLDLQWSYGDINAGDRVIASPPGGWVNNWHLVELYCRASDNQIELIIDGVSLGTATQSATVGHNTAPDITLGTSHTGTFPAQYDLADLLICSHNLELGERAFARAAFQAKYGADLGI